MKKGLRGRICTKKEPLFQEGGGDTFSHYLGKADGGETGTQEEKETK